MFSTVGVKSGAFAGSGASSFGHIIFSGTLPPAGTILSPKDLASLLRPLGRKTRRRSLETALAKAFEVPEVRLFSSGRAAMTVVLKAMAELRPDRKTVIVPGYTCFSVPASVVRAGLRVRPVEIDVNTLSYLPTALETACGPDVLCIVSGNLFGQPDDLVFLERFAKRQGAFFLDDAAQAFYATVDGRFAGAFGDAGILSFDKGKNITTIEGGAALLRNSELADRIRPRWEALTHPRTGASAALVAKVLIYAALLRPRLYTLPARLLPLGGTPFEIDFPIMRYCEFLAPLAASLLARIEEITERRRTRARWLSEAVPATPHITAPTASSDQAVHLRFPLILGNQTLRDHALTELSSQGLGAAQFYPAALDEVPELEGFLDPAVPPTLNARSVARRILTLPTHEYVRPADVEKIGEILERVVRSPARI